MINSIRNLIKHIAHPAEKQKVKETPADEKTKAVAAKHINQRPLTKAQQNLLLAMTLAKPSVNNEEVAMVEINNTPRKTEIYKNLRVNTNKLTEAQENLVKYFT